MRVPVFAEKRSIGRKCHISGDFLPGELEGIRGEPHVLGAAAERAYFPLRRVVCR
jgi:hypothetical protein